MGGGERLGEREGDAKGCKIVCITMRGGRELLRDCVDYDHSATPPFESHSFRLTYSTAVAVAYSK